MEANVGQLFEIILSADALIEILLFCKLLVCDDFGWLQPRELVKQRRHNILAVQFGGVECAGRNVRIRVADAGFRIIQGEDIVVLRTVKHLFFNDGARRDHARNGTRHKPLCKRRILHLLADGNLVSLRDHFVDIGIYGMIRHAAHRRTLVKTAVATGQRQFQDLRSFNGVVEEHLVEVSETVKQEAVGILLLHFHILPHHRRQFIHFASSRELHSCLQVLQLQSQDIDIAAFSRSTLSSASFAATNC